MDIFTLIQFFIDNGTQYIILTVIVLAIYLAFRIGFHEHKKEIWSRISHRRNKYYFIAMIIYVAGIFVLWYWRLLSVASLLIIIPLYVIYCVFCILSLKSRLECRHWILKRYRNLLDQGFAAECKAFFEAKPPWFLLDADEQIEYKLLKASYWIDIYNYVSAYKTLLSIKDEELYEEEITYVNMRKAMCLSSMGSMGTALELLGKPDENNSKDPMIWMTYSYIHEMSGDVQKAFEFAKKAKDLLALGGVSKARRAAIYIDYSRYTLIHGNESDSLHHYKLAFKEAKLSNNAICLNGAVSGLVDLLVSLNEVETCKAILEEYLKYVDISSSENITTYETCLVKC